MRTKRRYHLSAMLPRTPLSLPFLAAVVAACLLSCASQAQASAQAAIACQGTYTAELSGSPALESRCDIVADLVLCLHAATADLPQADAKPFLDFKDLVLSQNTDCTGPTDPGSPPSIVTDDDNLAVSVGEGKDVVIQRHRRESVSLFDLAARVEDCEGKMSDAEGRIASGNNATLEALTSVTSTFLSTLEGRITDLVKEQTSDLKARMGSAEKQLDTIGAQVGQVAAAVDGLCNSYQYKVTSTGACKALTLCKEDQYQSTAPTVDSDRACKTYTTCGADSFETKPPTATSDRVCTPHTACGSDEYQISAGSAFRDTICRPVVVCTARQIEVVPPTATTDRQCAMKVLPRTCLELYEQGDRNNGIAVVYPDGRAGVDVYCLNKDGSERGFGWMLMMRVSKRDSNIDFRSNAEGWKRASYQSVKNINFATQVANVDFISELYKRQAAKDILVAESVTSPKYSVWGKNCLGDNSLGSLLTPNAKTSNGYACCSISYGSGTPRQPGYNTLLINGDENVDNEPGKIAIRSSCTGDSESLQLGYTRASHGNHEVYSQGSHWGNLQGMFVFVR